MKKLAIVSALLVFLLLAASPALAQAARGENIAVLKDSVTTKLPGGRSYVTTGNRQVMMTVDPKHPLNGASGDCDGACVMDESGASTCMGSCTFVDREADIAFFTWDGLTEGGWKLAGGSGKWKGASGQGTWKNTETVVPGKFLRNGWEGTITMVKK
jgi:hypothetical protein